MVIERIANENCFDRCFVVATAHRRERCETRAATPKRSSSPVSESDDVDGPVLRADDSESDEGEGAKEGITGNQCFPCGSSSCCSSPKCHHCLFTGPKEDDHLYLLSLYWQDYLLPTQQGTTISGSRQGYIH
jgi:hypothetical protein